MYTHAVSIRIVNLYPWRHPSHHRPHHKHPTCHQHPLLTLTYYPDVHISVSKAYPMTPDTPMTSSIPTSSTTRTTARAQALAPDTYHLLHVNRFSESLRDAREGDLFNSLGRSHPNPTAILLAAPRGKPAPSAPSGAIALPSQASVALPNRPPTRPLLHRTTLTHDPPSTSHGTYCSTCTSDTFRCCTRPPTRMK